MAASTRREEADVKVVEAKDSARSAGLRYVSDERPGIARRRVGKGFRYVSAAGAPVRDDAELRRIRALAIPPAWTHVWICPDASGHVQATGRDAKARKQYRYHARWREVRDETKYGRMEAFGKALPRIRERAAHDLSLAGLPREKVIATVVQLLELTLIRIGNEEYARNNASFGLTTLRERHVTVEGRHLHFRFRGKSAKVHAIDVSDPRLARIVKRCQDLPGQELFHFRDETTGDSHPIESTHVNAYLREAAGEDFTAKDFRTWHGTLLAACALAELGALGPPTRKGVVEAVQRVAARLGNTPTVCRKSYVHPAIIERYLRGDLIHALENALEPEAREAALLLILREEAA
jgi:DNA topoisomerase-1